jgi:hypothetical protein
VRDADHVAPCGHRVRVQASGFHLDGVNAGGLRCCDGLRGLPERRVGCPRGAPQQRFTELVEASR